MSGIEAVLPVGLGTDPMIGRLNSAANPAPAASGQPDFAELLASGVRQVEAKLSQADDMVQRFALDDSVPLHKVTYALEEARLAVELAMQVRTRLIESYRELMNMQL